MSKDETQAVADSALWKRIAMVGLTAAMPLFAVSLILIHVAYSDKIAFGLQEQRGNAFERPLERLLELLPLHQFAARQKLANESETQLQFSEAEQRIDEALRGVTRAYEGELGQALGFSDSALGAEGRANARLAALRDEWQALRRAPLPVAADGTATLPLLESVRAMMEHAGNSSNLVLDDDLDSFYLMDMTLTALPENEQRVADITLRVSDWLRRDQWRSKGTEIAVMTATLRTDLSRIVRDARTSLSEDAHFNATCPSLQHELPPAVARLEAADQQLLTLLDRIVAGEAVMTADFEKTGWSAHASAFRLFEVGVDQLDRLLSLRVQAIRRTRLQAYFIITATLALAGIGVGLITRSLLAARYAEILKNQEQLHAKEAQLRTLGNNLPDGMMYQVMRDFDGAMRFLYVSAGVERLHGVSAEAVLADAATLYDQIFPEDLPAVRAAEAESLARMGAFKVVVRTRRRDGAARFMELFSSPRKLADGRVVWDGIEIDITERQLAEAATKQSQQRFSHIFENSPIPITLAEASNGRIIAANSSFLKFAGFNQQEVIGRTTAELGIYPDADERAYIIEQLRLHGKLHAHPQDFVSKTGKRLNSVLWVDLVTIGAEKWIVAIALDVTEQKAAERQQKALEDQLRQAQKLEALGTLAGGIAHDFNNILGAIISYTELSKLDNPGNAELALYLDEVLKASGRASALVRQILSFSRQQKEERRNLQLGPIVQEALSLLRATLPSTIALEHELKPGVGNVLANPTQLHQIVMNLCTNAAHAMKGHQGQIRVELEQVEISDTVDKPHVELRGGSYVRLSVSDTGHGMDAATLQRVFEPFFTTKAAGEGTGLGLSVVHGIVKEYGGVITVESQLGRGTRFSIYLPVSVSKDEPRVLPVAAAPRGQGQHILVVDDERALGEAARRMLQRLGYEPTVFQRSVDALNAFREQPLAYDALITDLTMPDLTGAELAREVLSIRPGFPIILSSGSSGQQHTEAELRGIGICELLDKPIDWIKLAHVLAKVLTS